MARLLLVFLLPAAAGGGVVLGAWLVATGIGPRSLVFAALAALGVAGWLALAVGRRLDRLTHFARVIGSSAGARLRPRVTDDALGALEQSLAETQDRVAHAVASLERDRERTRGILRAMVEGVVVLASSGEVMLMNECAERLFGLPDGFTYAGRHLIELCREPALQEIVRGTLEEAPVRSAREVAIGAGEPRHLSVGIARVGEAEGTPFAFVLVFHDITELKRLETMRRDFVANVSHEVRTPLTAIRGYAETLLSGGLEDRKRARQFVAVIDRHSERLSRLIDDLLNLSDLELGRTSLKLEDVPVARLVDDVLEVVSEKAERGAVTLAKEIPAELPPLRGDPDRLQQVLINLADNAVKYTPAGGSVTISARQAVNGAGPTVEILVSDTGVGIPPADLPRLTERFYRVDKARSRELGGTGLGLAIVKHIVQGHGGSLEITSSVNHGTIVRVAIPAADAGSDR